MHAVKVIMSVQQIGALLIIVNYNNCYNNNNNYSSDNLLNSYNYNLHDLFYINFSLLSHHLHGWLSIVLKGKKKKRL